jgi:drug/metabolite transporter (DMT)-like permease
VSRHRNLLLFLALAVMWGSSFVAIKAGLEQYGFPPVLFAAVRYDVAGLLMLAYAAYAVDDPLPRSRGEVADVVVSAVFIIAGYHALLFVGEVNTTSAAAAVIVSLSPVLTTGIARGVLPGERLSRLGVVGLLTGLVGVALLASPDPGNLLTADVLAKGLVFAAALSFAVGSVLTRRIDSGLAIEPLEAWSMLLGALLMHGLSAAAGESAARISVELGAVVSLGYLAVVASALGFLVYFRLLDRLGPIEINLVSYVTPIVAAVGGFLLLGEVIDAATALGFLVVLAGFLLVKWDAITSEVRSLRGRSLPGDD